MSQRHIVTDRDVGPMSSASPGRRQLTDNDAAAAADDDAII